MSNKPGDLPFAVQEQEVQATRNWQYEIEKELVYVVYT